MHWSSMRNMETCRDKYVTPEFLNDGPVTVVDVGAAGEGWTYRSLFSEPRHFRYIGADLEPGENVDVVLTDPYILPFPDQSVDLVISGQMLEHCEFFWVAFQEMARILKPSGYIFLIAPSSGPVHRFPVDCWRFYPDAYPAPAKWSKCECVEKWRDNAETDPPNVWRDMVGVFRRKPEPAATRALDSPG